MILHSDVIGSSVELTRDDNRYERIFQFINVTAPDKLRTVTQHPGIPRIGDAHPNEPAAKAISVFATPLSNTGLDWTVTVRYSTASDSLSGEKLSLSDPIEIRYESRTTTETTIYDRLGNKMISAISATVATITTTTHRVELERPGVVINITRTTRTNPTRLNALYGGKCNSGKWGPYSRYQVLCESFEGEGQKGAGLWRVTGRFYPSPLLDGTWRTQVISANSSNVIPADARLGRGIEQYEPYPLAALRNSGFTP